MKKTHKFGALVAALLVSAAAQAQVSLNTAAQYGDFLVGVQYTPDGVGTKASGNNLVIDLGSAASVGSFGSINISSDLAAAFGADWASKNLIYGAFSIDAARNVYASLDSTSSDVTSLSSISPASQQAAKTGAFSSLLTSYNNNRVGGNTTSVGVLMGAGDNYSWSYFNTPGIGSAFGLYSVNLNANIGNAANIWQMASAYNQPGNYVDTMILDQNGNLSVAANVPEPSTYAMMGLSALIMIVLYRRKIQS